jgi:hypothetical protein
MLTDSYHLAAFDKLVRGYIDGISLRTRRKFNCHSFGEFPTATRAAAPRASPQRPDRESGLTAALAPQLGRRVFSG